MATEFVSKFRNLVDFIFQMFQLEANQKFRTAIEEMKLAEPEKRSQVPIALANHHICLALRYLFVHNLDGFPMDSPPPP